MGDTLMRKLTCKTLMRFCPARLLERSRRRWLRRSSLQTSRRLLVSWLPPKTIHEILRASVFAKKYGLERYKPKDCQGCQNLKKKKVHAKTTFLKTWIGNIYSRILIKKDFALSHQFLGPRL